MGKKGSYYELICLFVGMLIGGAFGIALFAKTHHPAFLTLTGLGMVVGLVVSPIVANWSEKK